MDDTELVVSPEKLDFFLDFFDLTFDDQDYIVEDTPEQKRVMAKDGEPIQRDDIGYVAPDDNGDPIFIRDNFSKITEHLSDRR